MPVNVPTVTTVSVPTQDEFAALAARVTALEGGTGPGPDPDPEVPQNLTGVPNLGAMQIALNWDDFPGADTYTIRCVLTYNDVGGELVTDPPTEFTGIVGSSSLRGSPTPLGQEGRYVYTVAAVVDSVETGQSAPVTVILGAFDPGDEEESPGDESPGEESPGESPGEPIDLEDLEAYVIFDDADFTGLMEGDSGIRQWDNDGPNKFEWVDIDGTKWGRASIVGGPHGSSIRAEGQVCVPGDDGDKWNILNGMDLWFGVDIMVEPGTPDDLWCTVLQWKNEGTGSPPVALTLRDGQFCLEFGGDTDQHDIGAIDAGTAHRYVIHIDFENGGGSVEAWRDGVKVFNAYEPEDGTLYTASGKTQSYAKIGYYRAGAETATGRIHYRDYRVATTKALVE